MENNKYRITLVLTCDSEGVPWLSKEWFVHKLMREISCCTELYELETIKIEEVKNDVTGDRS